MKKDTPAYTITESTGEIHPASAPIIISASRATDIPAFYSTWLTNRLRDGYVKWKNPFSGLYSYVSFAEARLFVFWSKNPASLMKHLDFFDERGFGYYFQYTLNDYEPENWESGLPSLSERIETFQMLSERIGKQKVIWRFDPLIISDNLSIDQLLRRIERIGDQIHEHTQRLVFSFIDIENYRRVKQHLSRLHEHIREFDLASMEEIASGIADLNRKWGLKLGTCSEAINLKRWCIEHNRCVDDRLIHDLFPQDHALMKYLGYQDEDQADLFSDQTDDTSRYARLKDKETTQKAILSFCVLKANIESHMLLFCTKTQYLFPCFFNTEGGCRNLFGSDCVSA